MIWGRLGLILSVLVGSFVGDRCEIWADADVLEFFLHDPFDMVLMSFGGQ